MEDYRMSKWIKGKQELFKKNKKEVESRPGPRRSDITWKTPDEIKQCIESCKLKHGTPPYNAETGFMED